MGIFEDIDNSRVADTADQELMTEIIHVHFPDIEQELLDQTMEAFYWVRSIKDIQKKPSTSELIDWIAALKLSGIPYEKIAQELPFAGVLLKKNEDLDTMQAELEKKAAKAGD